MMKALKHSHNLWIRPEQYDKFLDQNIRKKLEKIIPAIVKDYDIVCNGIDEVTKKYGLPQGEFKLWDSDLMRFGAKFKADGMSDEELLKVIEQRFRAVSEVSFRFFSWLGFGTKFSPERQALLEKGVRVPGLPGRLRRSGFLVMDWPPNTGDPRKDEKIIADVKEHLERDWAEVFTPEGRLKLVNGEIVFVRPKRRKTTKP